MHTPKILMVANFYDQIGGISGLVQNLSAGLSRDGYLVHVHSVGGAYFQRIKKYIQLISLAKDYDLIHCHASARLGFLPAYIGAIIGSRYKKRLILTYHSAPSTAPFIENNFLVKHSIHNFSVVTTPSEETASIFRKYGAHVVAIPNILDLENWPYRERSCFSPNMVWTRNIYYPELAIKAFQIVKKDFPEATLTMCGKHATESYLYKYRNLPGLQLLGSVPRNNLPAVLDKADIYINTMGNESFGYAVYEAMAMGLAIVSVPSSAVYQWGGDEAIFFAENNIPESFAETLIKVIRDQEETKARVQSSKLILNTFSWENLSSTWEQLYRLISQ